MKIAIIGIRGIPVVYSGYEIFSEIVSSQLVKNGHRVTVYCRSGYVVPEKKEYKGVRLIVLPSIRSKNFDTISHSFLSTLHACFQDYDVILYLSVGNSIFSIVPRLFGKKTLVNVDGLDWKRKKWGWFAQKFLYYSEYLATILPNAIITDSIFIKNYYQQKYSKASYHIPYGGFVDSSMNESMILKKYGLKKNQYFIWNGRLVPENHIEDLIQAFKRVKTNHRCVILGDDLYKSEYKKKLLNLAKGDKRFLFPGFVPHESAKALVKNSFAYVETKRSGGTHPSLVEAMSVGSLIICSDLHANKEVLGERGIYYSMIKGSKNLKKRIEYVLLPEMKDKIEKKRMEVKKHAEELYNWNRIVSQYEYLFQKQVC